MDQTIDPPLRPTIRFGWRAKVALLASTLLVILLLDIVAARVYGAVTGHPWPAGNPARAYRIPADPYHHGLLANFSTDGADWGGNYPFRTNSLGFKDAHVRDVPLAPAGRRIVVIGDSFTEGVGVRYEETFAGRLGSALAPSAVEVLNAGVQSYSPIIYYRKIKYLLEEAGLRFDELVVAVDLSDAANEQDYRLVDDVVRPISYGDRVAEILRTNSILVWTIADRIKGKFGYVEVNGAGTPGARSARDAAQLGSDAEIEAALRALPSAGRITWPHDDALFHATVESGARSMFENMDRLLKVVTARGIPLTLVIYPWPDQVIAGDPDCRHVRIWRDWCGKNGVRFVDAFPKFEIGSSWKRRAETIDACYINGDMHLNAEGHRRVAEAILDSMSGPSPSPK